MTHDPTHDAETDAIVAELEKAGLIETFTDDEGKVAYRPTPKGAQVGGRWRRAGTMRQRCSMRCWRPGG
jgi:DNA-binding PadR family transcriptional regulator